VPIDVYVDTDQIRARQYLLILWIVLVLGLLSGMIFLGKSVTPQGGKVLTWSEWQILLAHRSYEKELVQLQQDAEILAELVKQSPDPVRAQFICDRITTHTLDGQAALTVQRSALAEAADAVQQWAVGATIRDEALLSLDAAIQSLQQLSPRPQVSP
jgi:hypothetical protein